MSGIFSSLRQWLGLEAAPASSPAIDADAVTGVDLATGDVGIDLSAAASSASQDPQGGESDSGGTKGGGTEGQEPTEPEGPETQGAGGVAAGDLQADASLDDMPSTLLDDGGLMAEAPKLDIGDLTSAADSIDVGDIVEP